MPFTNAQVLHRYLNADGSPSSGEVVFSLLAPITNGGVTIAPTHLTVPLAGDGSLTASLTSTLDPDTIPQVPPVYWRVSERLQGAPQRDFEVQMPSGNVSVDLGALMPFVTSPSFA